MILGSIVKYVFIRDNDKGRKVKYLLDSKTFFSMKVKYLLDSKILFIGVLHKTAF